MAIVHATDATFDEEVLKSDKPVLVDFWAEWCGPCKAMEPALSEISDEEGNLKVVKVNVDENIQYPQQYGIMSIPNMILFKDGQPVEQLIGLMPKENVMAKLRPHLG